MYISQYIYIAYVYLYICIYVYAIDTCKENERKGSWYVDEAFFFSFSTAAFTPCISVPSEHQEKKI